MRRTLTGTGARDILNNTLAQDLILDGVDDPDGIRVMTIHKFRGPGRSKCPYCRPSGSYYTDGNPAQVETCAKVIGLAALGVVLIVVCVLGSVRAGTRVFVRTYRMEVAFNGKAPWGDVGPEVEGEGSPTVLYRRVGNSYCYTAFESEQLTTLLKREGGKQATVQYNVFSTFGREGKYALR
jgi:hypothetical protein